MKLGRLYLKIAEDVQNSSATNDKPYDKLLATYGSSSPHWKGGKGLWNRPHTVTQLDDDNYNIRTVGGRYNSGRAFADELNKQLSSTGQVSEFRPVRSNIESAFVTPTYEAKLDSDFPLADNNIIPKSLLLSTLNSDSPIKKTNPKLLLSDRPYKNVALHEGTHAIPSISPYFYGDSRPHIEGLAMTTEMAHALANGYSPTDPSLWHDYIKKYGPQFKGKDTMEGDVKSLVDWRSKLLPGTVLRSNYDNFANHHKNRAEIPASKP
jgi:hypothetical protein